MKAFRDYKWPLGQDHVEDRHRWDDVLANRGGKRPPERVRNLRYTGGNEKVSLQWDPPVILDNVGGYRIYFDSETNLVREITDPGTTAADIVVNDPSNHNFFVAAMSSLKKESPLSLVVGKAAGFSSSSLFNPQGNFVDGQFIMVSISFTSNSGTLTWGAQSKLRSDGSTLSVLAGSKIYNGLSGSTKYYVYARVKVSTGVIEFVNADPPATTPDTLLAAQCELDGYVPIPVITFTTTSSGSGSGTGGGGDTCPEIGEAVEVADDAQGTNRRSITAGEVQVGQFIRGRRLSTDDEVFRRVQAFSVNDCAAWRDVNDHLVTPAEPVYWSDSWTPAMRVPGSTFDGRISRCANISIETDEYDEANYSLISGVELVIHNPYFPC